MHILISLLSVIGTVAFIVWRLRLASDMAHDIVGFADDVYKFGRRKRWQFKVHKPQKTLVEDPREAIAALYHYVLHFHDLSHRRSAEIVASALNKQFHLDNPETRALVARGQWHVHQYTNANKFIRDFTRIARREFSEADREQFVLLALALVHVVDNPDPRQIKLIQSFQKKLGVAIEVF
ncbi:MAG: hypothetical protein ACR2OW_02605 [Methyloligellaceae bacterium]